MCFSSNLPFPCFPALLGHALHPLLFRSGFSSLALVTCFPALKNGYLFPVLRNGHIFCRNITGKHIFQRLAPVANFSRAVLWLQVFVCLIASSDWTDVDVIVLALVLRHSKKNCPSCLPPTNLLESINNAKEVRSFLGFIVPAVHHQIDKFWLYFYAREIWAKWRLFVGHNAMISEKHLKTWFLQLLWKNHILKTI